MPAPALYWQDVVYQTSNWTLKNVLDIAASSITAIGLTNIQYQQKDVYAFTSSMILAVGVVHIGNTFVVNVMGAGTNKTEVHTAFDNQSNKPI